MKTWLTNLALATAAFAITLSIGMPFLHWQKYRVNLTDSLPRGLYQETEELIHRGSLVVECLPKELATLAQERGWIGKGSCPWGTMPILKQVVGLPGDEIDVSASYVAVNGTIIPRSATQKQDSRGRPVPAIARGIYRLKEGEVFLLATNIPNSWDSRYSGPAKLSDIIATARPVLTEAANNKEQWGE